MSEWKEVRLGELVSVKGGKRLPKGTQLITAPNTHPYIRIRDITGKKTIELDSSYEYVDEETQKIISRYIVNTGDILVSIVGTIGLVSIVGKSLNLANLTENCVKLVDIRNVDCEYLYYYLVSELGQNEISKGTVGAVQPKLPIKNIESIIVKLPSIPTQRRISAILSSLDAKIENNNKENAKLEEIAQNLFKEWFVDFGPFKDGKFVDSELGPIPEGWRVERIATIVENTIAGDWGKDNEEGNFTSKVACIRGADIEDVKVGNKGKMPTRYILPKNFAAKHLESNDIIIEISGGSPTQSTGRVCLISNSLLSRYNNALVCTNFCRAIKPVSGYSMFLYQMWKNLYNKGVMLLYENGTTGIKNLALNDLLDKEMIVLPPKDVAVLFEKMVSSFERIIQHNGFENEKYSSLRDTLLPKLMSGEIEV